MTAKSFRVEWAEVARRDLEEIIDFVYRKSPAAALQLVDTIERRAASLATMPNRGRIPPELVRFQVQLYHELLIPPYRLLYRVDEERVNVLGVFDGRRDLQDVILARLLSQ